MMYLLIDEDGCYLQSERSEFSDPEGVVIITKRTYVPAEAKMFLTQDSALTWATKHGSHKWCVVAANWEAIA